MPRATNYSSINVGPRRTTPGTDINLIKAFTVTVDPASIATTAGAEQTVTVTGAAVGDFVLLQPPAGFETLVVGQARVSAANTVKFMLQNPTGGPIDAASGSWKFLIIRP